MDELKFLVVGDDPSKATDLEQKIKAIGCSPVKTVSTTQSALQYLNEAYVDAVIANVSLNGGLGGIELAATLRERNLPVFLISADDDPALYQQVKRTFPAGYFIEPIQQVTLQSAIDTALRKNGSPKKDSQLASPVLKGSFFVKQNNLLRKVPIKDVLWIRTEGNYSIIHTITKKYILKLSLKKVLEQLPQDYFIQIQRAYIVALPKIQDIDIGSSEVIVNKNRLPLGRNYREALFSCLRILK